jgi:hypothetical protein
MKLARAVVGLAMAGARPVASQRPGQPPRLIHGNGASPRRRSRENRPTGQALTAVQRVWRAALKRHTPNRRAV